jgi:hypothetical protein
MAVIRFGT